ncbi:MAG: 2-oxoacid:acceptor oxidoreductase family protein [Spirochaetales bacterium]|nr:2-oxoacid:acceptor oxidoreductase family protein [Spirochaetales bacterium]
MGNKILKKSEAFYDVFFRKPGDEKKSTTYCAGCGHGIIHKLIAEAITDLGMTEKTTFVSPVGCSVFAYYYFKTGNVEAAHGRAPAVATAVKRSHPDSYVICYQGDGDLAAIGTAEILHAANRGENITVIFVNNAIYGMTGGQMAPTSLLNQKTATSPFGRDEAEEGYPLRMSEIIATLDAPVLVARTSVHDIKNIMQTRKLIRKALNAQKDKKGFSFIEILSQCPTNWKVKPEDAQEWMEKNMLPYYKREVFKDILDQAAPVPHPKPRKEIAEIVELLALPEFKTRKDNGGETTLKTIRRETKFKIAGFGGQGVLSLGAFLCELAIVNHYHSTWIPSYGPEMRGGTANCSVILSPEEIASPVVQEIDILVAFNHPSLVKFHSNVKEEGLIFYNNSIINDLSEIMPYVRRKKIQLIGVDASNAADSLGDPRMVNVAMLGHMIKVYPYFQLQQADLLLEKKFSTKPRLVELNKQALRRGFEQDEMENIV